ncbi:MAG: hypothetical protein IT371_04070 [Deltaproteobacteria bacterium]|nr:hypothetical protein [Deltaproteobacteria bacterium]
MMTTSRVLLLGLFLVSCRASTHADAGTGLDHASPSRDGMAGPRISVSVSYLHLLSNLPADSSVHPHVVTSGIASAEEMVRQLTAATTLTVWKSKTVLPSAWKIAWNGGTQFSMEFAPTAGFSADTDYVLTIRKQGAVVPTREVSLFRIGSLPRVKQVCFGPAVKGMGTDIGSVTVRLSETVAASSLLLELSRRADSGWAAFAAPIPMSTQGAGTEMRFTFAAPLDPNVPVKLVLPATVEAPTGKKLDGKYSGQSGSGPLEVELLPGKYAKKGNAADCWEPTLTY